MHAAGLWKVHIRTLGNLCASLLLHKERRKGGERGGKVMKGEKRRALIEGCREETEIPSPAPCGTSIGDACVFCVCTGKNTHSHTCTLTHTLSDCRCADDGCLRLAPCFVLVFFSFPIASLWCVGALQVRSSSHKVLCILPHHRSCVRNKEWSR